MAFAWPLTGWLLASFLLALVCVRGAIAYAHRRGMLDQPGQRRSHTVPTPRGGGIGVVVGMLLTAPSALVFLGAAWPVSVAAALGAALLLVAAVGWWDDHRPLGVRLRLLVQLAATALFSLALLRATEGAWLWLPLLVLAGAWSINLHNFMDGIDGLLAQQAIFASAGMGLLAWFAGQPALAAASFCLTAASMGFWLYNRPPAKIFMGDVGSGSIGLLLFAFAAMLWRAASHLLWPALLLCSAFVADASLTLLTRFLRGRRWYAAHREHLYQWVVRSGRSHAGSDRLYLYWNLLIAAPAAAIAACVPAAGLPLCVLGYATAFIVWISSKRYILRRLRRRRPRERHVTA
ncbi:MraY family glycosyltransferase [Frateuria defendens]|uniref:MraY family glycosyltransferase n=1 Tax=Frateuria defendens TaxID=2219559 RepID=UPI001F2B778A|nr:glycosyltransferase family 4 protein [Frateuria defendens]